MLGGVFLETRSHLQPGTLAVQVYWLTSLHTAVLGSRVSSLTNKRLAYWIISPIPD